MGGQKWDDTSIVRQIVETARIQADAAVRASASLKQDVASAVPLLDPVAVQSLAARIGDYAWRRRLNRGDLQGLSTALLRAGVEAGDGPGLPQQAFASVMDDVLRALSYGEEGVVPWCEPWQIEQRVCGVWRAPEEERSVVDVAFVRSLLEPLIAGDRATFRSLLGTLGRELVILGARGVDGKLPNVTSLLGYRQLVALQAALNGILHASRAKS